MASGAWGGGVGTSYGSASITLYINENLDEGNNRSSFSWWLDLYNSTRAWNYDAVSNWSVYVANQWWSGAISYNFPNGGGTIRVSDGGTGWIGHNADGSGSISVYAEFSGPGPITSGNTGWQGYTMANYYRPPTSTATPYFTVGRSTGSGYMQVNSSGETSGRPGVDFIRYHVYNRSTGAWADYDRNTILDFYGDYNVDYQVYATSHNSEGWGPDSGTLYMWAFPYINSVTLPANGTVGKPYTGASITGQQVSSYFVQSGSLPPGLSISGSSIVGTPTTPGFYTFTLQAVRDGVGYSNLVTKTIQILAGGPWVYLETPWVDTSVSNVAVTSNVATVTVGANHGITELNQPVTIAGLTGGNAVLNGTWHAKSWTANTVTFDITTGNIASNAVTGATFKIFYKRSSIKVNLGTPAAPNWVQAYTRIWNATTGKWENTA